MAHRARLDDNNDLRQFCKDLEKACISTVDEDGKMTKDLALSVYGNRLKRPHYVTTSEFMDKIAKNLARIRSQHDRVLQDIEDRRE